MTANYWPVNKLHGSQKRYAHKTLLYVDILFLFWFYFIFLRRWLLWGKLNHRVSAWYSLYSPYWAALLQWEHSCFIVTLSIMFISILIHRRLSVNRLLIMMCSRINQPRVVTGMIFRRRNWRLNWKEIYNFYGCVLYWTPNGITRKKIARPNRQSTRK